MSESAATKSSPRTIKAGRKLMRVSYASAYNEHWVREEYASGEFQIHGPFANKEAADNVIADLKSNGGMFSSHTDPT